MRTSLTATLLIASLLGACSSTVDRPVTKISQSGALKVHPGLLGQPVPAELQTPINLASAPDDTATPQTPTNEETLRSQRSLYFALNQTDLKPDYEPILMAHARYLSQRPSAKMRVEGHADERGSRDYNKRLGLKRAQSVRATLLGHGAAPAQITIKSWGNSRPKISGRDESAWAENRRADLVYEQEH